MLLKIGLAVAAFPVIYILIALTLIFINTPAKQETLAPANAQGLDFSGTLNQDLSSPAPLQSMPIANTSPVNYRFYKNNGETNRLIVLIHGSGWHSMQYVAMAKYLTRNGLGHVVTPDLRGHGENPQRRGDVDYIGQLEDDIAALVSVQKKQHNLNQVIIAGHSSGGGLTIRLAGGQHGQIADGWVLFSPFIKYDAPTARQNSGNWAYPLVPRTIGLVMLNNLGISRFNNLVSIQFNMPKTIREGPLGHTATLAYSYRLNTSYSPRPDYGADLAAMNQPMLLIAGRDDEAFMAHAYEATLSKHVAQGEYHLLEGLGHIDLTNDETTFAVLGNWLGKL